MRIVFMGTPGFAVPSLESLVRAGYKPVAVVTSPDRQQGRGRKPAPSPVKRAAIALGIPLILQPESVRDPGFAQDVDRLSPDVIVVVAFRILPPAVFESARLGAFNLHGSLLPRYRGAAPIHHAVLHGDTETGVTTFFLREKVDTGNVILQRSMSIGPDETTGDVHDRMMHLGAAAVVDTVRAIEAGEAVGRRQDDALATPAPKVFTEQACVDWSQDSERVHNWIRGYSPVPGAWTMHGGTRLKLLRSARSSRAGLAGTVIEANDRLVVACGAGAVEITELQQQGRRALSAAEFLRGYDLKAGDELSCP